MSILSVPTKPFPDQKPGTSGLRKHSKVFEQPHYLENFVQAIFNTDASLRELGAILVVGGDGRYLNDKAVQIIIKMAHANKVSKVVVAQNGVMSTPAVSALVRSIRAKGAIILTASHNPGGPDADFGIKYNVSNGGPAPESVTDEIFMHTKSISQYYISELPNVDISQVGTHHVEGMVIDIVDSVANYLSLLKSVFDFEMIKANINWSEFRIHIDCMHGVSGPYARRIFVDELGAPSSSVVHDTPLPDFAGGHPDPNLTYAHDLVDVMKKGIHHLGAAFDGDADRNMILGHNAFFVTPSDSVAVIAHYASSCIPYFKGGLKGLSRSMPTGGALDHVAAKMGVPFFEVPTGWKFFGNLMDHGQLSICGEESFGTGSDHIREKDGVWAVLCWLSILAHTKKSIQEVLLQHWKTYGRNFFTRYDYEGVSSEAGDALMAHLRHFVSHPTELVGKTFGSHTVQLVDDFSYTDPTNGQVTPKQGIRVVFTDGSRAIFRLSGTGSSGATIRVYIDSYVSDPSKYELDAQVVLKPFVDIALSICKLQEFTQRTEPTVIT